MGISSGSDGTRKLVMLYPLTYYTSFQLCTLLGQMDVNWAVYQDGGPSAALHIADQLPALNEIHDHPEEGCASDDCRVAYAVGLVALGANLVQNAGFEAPDITSAPPCGRGGSDTHPFQNYVWTDPSQQCYRSWIGSTFLRRMSLAHGRQVAAIGNRVPLNPEDIGNYLVQTIAVPNNTYCELHFWHGFNRDTQGFGCPSLEQSSNLDVTIDDDAGQQITSLHQTWSDTSTLGQAGLRFLTPPSG